MSKKRKRKKKRVKHSYSLLYTSSDSSSAAQPAALHTPDTPEPGASLAPAFPPVAVAGATSSHGPQELRKLPASVPVFGPDPPYHHVSDEDGHPLYVTESNARQLMLKGQATFLRKTKHIRGIRIVPEILREKQKPTSIRSASVTEPIAYDTADNCVGCYSYDAPLWRRDHNGNVVREPATSQTYRALPEWAKEILFRRVVLECSAPTPLPRAA